jgi:phosphatidylserine/phosphatidylglycerophosphate/cardiolipin synthase-like enzyme
MGYLHIPGESETAGGSRYNQYEAENIAHWITSQHDRLVGTYGKAIEEIVAVVTPFKAQKMAVYNQLRDKRCKKITVGTVHSLQGAERPIVIFSPVYGAFDRSMAFIDQKPNLLNVAVSRARHAFLVFGNMNLFNPKGQTPSALLARHIIKAPNEVKFPLVPRKSLYEHGGVEFLATLEDHRTALRSAFLEATKYIIIVSPLITQHGLEADGVCELIGEACDRGVEVSIYTDKTFYSGSTNLVKCSEQLTKAGANVHAVELFHNKTLIFDDAVLIEGSFNWLSAPRKGEFMRENHSIKYRSSKVKRFMETTLRQLEGR